MRSRGNSFFQCERFVISTGKNALPTGLTNSDESLGRRRRQSAFPLRRLVVVMMGGIGRRVVVWGIGRRVVVWGIGAPTLVGRVVVWGIGAPTLVGRVVVWGARASTLVGRVVVWGARASTMVLIGRPGLRSNDTESYQSKTQDELVHG